MNDLTKICFWKEVAVLQRKHELESMLDLSGTENYEKTGCFGCDGFKNYLCPKYTTRIGHIYKKEGNYEKKTIY